MQPYDHPDREKAAENRMHISPAAAQGLAAFTASSTSKAQKIQTQDLHTLAQVPSKAPKRQVFGDRITHQAATKLPMGTLLSGSAKPQGVLSPLEGTYKAPKHGVGLMPLKVGEFVQKGQVLGYIQVMDMLCIVEAPCQGSISSISVEHGQRVLHDESLMIIQPDKN